MHNPFRETPPSYDTAMAVPTSTSTFSQRLARHIPSTMPYLTPYLGLRARLSQVWFNRWTLLLFLVLVRVLIATMGLRSDLESARDKALSACTGVESMGSAMASMPHYMSKGVNELAASGIENGVRALEDTLLLMITGVQEIVVFIVNLMTSTYVCLITMAVRGATDVVVGAVKDIGDFVNDTMKDLFNEINDGVSTFEDSMNELASKIEAVPNFFGSNVDIPTLEFGDSLNKLKQVSIPGTFDDKLDKMQDSLPTFDEVKEAGDNAIRLPFQALTKLVNNSLGIYEFDRSVFPVPEKEVMTFCSDNPAINDFFDGLQDTISTVKKILTGVLVVLALLAMIPMAYREYWAWRSIRKRAYIISEPTSSYDPIDVVYIASRPASTSFGLKLASFFKSSRRQILVRWAVAYATSPAALFVLSLGLAGLAGVLCQYIMLKQVEKEAPALAAEIGDFADLVVTKLNDASTAWAVKTNDAINATNAELNDELFGWVRNSTDALNDTLTTFVDKMHDGVDEFFKGTPLADPINDVLNCLIDIKVQGIQKGLTWAHDHAHITFPTLPNDTFSLGALSSVASDSNDTSFLADPDSEATDKISEAVAKLTSKWADQLAVEAAISGAVTGIWILVCLIALVRTLIFCGGRDKVRAEGGAAPMDPRILTTFNGAPSRAAAGPSPQPVFPEFAMTKSDYATSPQDALYDEKQPEGTGIQMGNVARRTSDINVAQHRMSVHPDLYYKR